MVVFFEGCGGVVLCVFVEDCLCWGVVWFVVVDDFYWFCYVVGDGCGLVDCY